MSNRRRAFFAHQLPLLEAREAKRREQSRGSVCVAISSAMRLPLTGPALNPYVPQPTSTTKPSTGVKPMIGL